MTRVRKLHVGHFAFMRAVVQGVVHDQIKVSVSL